MEQEWVVESDFLHPVGSVSDSVNIMAPDNPAGPQPFRHLGRALSLDEWQPHDPVAEYLDFLTAVGYGDPAFAAFYPNSHSVFGFYDSEQTEPPPEGVQYELIGWYSDGQQDHLQIFLNNFRAVYQQENGAPPDGDTVRLALADELAWHVDLATGETIPDEVTTVCFAHLRFETNGLAPENPALISPQTAIVLGNTGLDALATHLAAVADTTATRSMIEDQLETVQLLSRLDQRRLDIDFKFREAQHESGFIAVPGGTLWTIRPETANDTAADATQGNQARQIYLPPGLASQLATANEFQTAYDQAQDQLESMRRQLFSDWYKYMLSAYPPPEARDDYPDIDEIKHYIEQRDITPLQTKVAETGRLAFHLSETQAVVSVSAPESDPTSVAGQLANALNQLLLNIGDHNNEPMVQAAAVTYVLQPTTRPRYWQPTEPVVLLTGNAVQPTTRHGQDGRLRSDNLLDCRLISDPALPGLIPANRTILLAAIDAQQPGPGEEHVAFSTWTEQPWHPFLLEWEVEIFPLSDGGNVQPQATGYSFDFLSRNYSLPLDSVDLDLRPGQPVARGANLYRGMSILTPYAGMQMQEQMEQYLARQLLPAYCAEQNECNGAMNADYFSANAPAVIAWYQNRPDPEAAILNVLEAYQALTDPQFFHLSQALSGFNDALLMHKQTLQVDIADPLGFADYQPFAATVRAAVQESLHSAPEPLNDFNPIRAGILQLVRLRLVDTFGRTLDLDVNQTTVPENMVVADMPQQMRLPPRFAQPACLNVRWLAADMPSMESNAHPMTTPICGWVLANHLDMSLAFYNSQGQALGAVTPNPDMPWQAAIGSETAVATPADITNPHLRQMAAYLLAQGVEFLADFINTIDTSLENIDPENFAQHQGMALLMARPLALVRATVSLDVQGLPAIHQGWNSFRKDLQRDGRDTANFIHVPIPIRIGENGQLNDGVIGFWYDVDYGYADDTFFTPQPNPSGNIRIQTYANGDLNLQQAIADPAQTLSLLMDPRGKLHLASGILPTKVIDIPPEHYAAALQAIEITFLTAPILNDRLQPPMARINLPLPQEPGYAWSWLKQTRTEETTLVEMVDVGPSTTQATFSGPQTIQEGWLKLSPIPVSDDGP
ncbi:hypothetical protein GC175_28210 [bacterium]|nr:hypothetical protein [bacterium]